MSLPVAGAGSAPIEPVPAPPATDRPGFMRRIVLYGMTRGTTEALLAARGLLLAALLGPAGFGAWTIFKLARKYAGFAEIGIGRGLEFDVSRGRTAGAIDVAEARASGRAALGFVALVFGALAAASVVASFVVSDALTAFGMRAFAVAIVGERIWMYAMAYLRAAGGLRQFAVLETVNAALHLGLAIIGAIEWGVRGAFCGLAVAAVASLVLVLARVPLRPVLDPARWARMLRVGLPIALTMMAAAALSTIDRIVVVALGGVEMLGYYAFAVAIAALAATFAWVVRTVVFPEVYRDAHADGADRAVTDLLVRTVRPFAVLYPPLLGAIALLVPPLVNTVIPKYDEAVGPAMLYLFTGATAGFSGLGTLGLVAVARQRRLPLFALAALGLNVVGSITALVAGWGLVGVAASALVSRAVYGVSILVLTARSAGIARPDRYVAVSVAPLAYCVVVMVVVSLLFPAGDFLDAAKALATYLVLLLPLLPLVRVQLRQLQW